MLLTSLNFDQNQRFFLNEAQNSGCLLKKAEIFSEAQKNEKKKTEIKTEKQITISIKYLGYQDQFANEFEFCFM